MAAALMPAAAARAETVAPDAPVLTSPASPGNDITPTWQWAPSLLATDYDCSLQPAGAPPVWQSGCTSPYEGDLSAAGDGDYEFRVRGTVAGLEGAESSDIYTLDTVAPDPPSVTSPPSPSNDTTPDWTFESEPGATFTCTLTPATGPSVPCEGPLTEDGSYTLSVVAQDAAGNTSAPSPGSYTLDTTPPRAPTITSGPSGVISAADITFEFTSDPADTTQCQLQRTGSAPAPWTTCTSPWAYGLSTEPDGEYTFSVKATDPAGNTGVAATRWFSLARPVSVPQQPSAPPVTPAVTVPTPEPLLRAGVCVNLFSGTPKADVLAGSPLGDVLSGLGGDDRLDGLAGDDCVLGDDGDDRLSGGLGNDDVRGLAGNDVVDGGPGDDSVTGGSGKDGLRGSSGSDFLSGGKGVDRFSGGAGDDKINAADGKRERVSCGSGRDSVTADRSDRLIGCEKKHLRGKKR